MRPFVSLFAVAAILFLVLDLIWLGVVAKGFYASEMGALLKKSPNLAAAAAFYLVYVAGLTLFVLMPSLGAGSVAKAALMGAAFGFVAYAAYDLTGLAVIEGFTLKLALVDLAWGTLASAAVAGTSVAIVSRLTPG